MANTQPDDALRIALDMVVILHNVDLVEQMLEKELSPAAKAIIERVATGRLDVSTADQHIRRLLSQRGGEADLAVTSALDLLSTGKGDLELTEAILGVSMTTQMRIILNLVISKQLTPPYAHPLLMRLITMSNGNNEEHSPRSHEMEQDSTPNGSETATATGNSVIKTESETNVTTRAGAEEILRGREFGPLPTVKVNKIPHSAAHEPPVGFLPNPFLPNPFLPSPFPPSPFPPSPFLPSPFLGAATTNTSSANASPPPIAMKTAPHWTSHPPARLDSNQLAPAPRIQGPPENLLVEQRKRARSDDSDNGRRDIKRAAVPTHRRKDADWNFEDMIQHIIQLTRKYPSAEQQRMKIVPKEAGNFVNCDFAPYSSAHPDKSGKVCALALGAVSTDSALLARTAPGVTTLTSTPSDSFGEMARTMKAISSF
ncbi:hypothetical protein P171DRAFT_501842 [Karstenula rhodostoma CBS 690.94]|uniref:Uncharacterized protein n=1 Tax=Karstenula rhodostoma CBS 690.94 TaxID=1392251 RepID=A0A9P4U6Y1_9PLEO|nr:hypothetical protein P171DRAFT_501842 [Karstenula rhodostoma CBS 690.94]